MQKDRCICGDETCPYAGILVMQGQDPVQGSSETELAWAAGFFDGEGSSLVQTTRQKSGNIYHYPKLSLSQNELQPLERFQAAIGGGTICGPFKARPKIRHWTVTGSQAPVLMARILPFLSDPKRRQWERVMKEVNG